MGSGSSKPSVRQTEEGSTKPRRGSEAQAPRESSQPQTDPQQRREEPISPASAAMPPSASESGDETPSTKTRTVDFVECFVSEVETLAAATASASDLLSPLRAFLRFLQDSVAADAGCIGRAVSASIEKEPHSDDDEHQQRHIKGGSTDVVSAALRVVVSALTPSASSALPAVALDALRLLVEGLEDPVVPKRLQLEWFGSHFWSVMLGLLASVSDWEETLVSACQVAIHRIATRLPRLRRGIRQHLHDALRSYSESKADDRHAFVAAVLRLLQPFYEGFRSPLAQQHLRDLMSCLVPLARVDKACQQQQQQQLSGAAANLGLETFRRPLLLCIHTLLQRVNPEKCSEVVIGVFEALLSYVDFKNPMKACGALSVIAGLTNQLDGDAFFVVHVKFLRIVGTACASDHSAVAAHGFDVLLEESVVALARRWVSAVISETMPGLMRRGVVHWAPTIASKTVDAISVLTGLAPDAASIFESEAVRHFGGDVAAYRTYTDTLHTEVARVREEEKALSEARAARHTFDALAGAARSATARRDFAFGKALGGGAYATVHYARRLEAGVSHTLWLGFAVKAVSKALVEVQQCHAAVAREAQIQRHLTELRVPGVLPLLHAFEDARHHYFVLEFCSRGDLFDAVCASYSPLNIQQHLPWLRYILLEIAECLAAVHAAGYYYGDLKAENVLIGDDGHVRLGDFGSAMSQREAAVAASFAGTLDYLAPEVLLATMSQQGKLEAGLASQNTVGSGAAADWWAYGCLVSQIVAGRLPFPSFGPLWSPLDVCKLRTPEEVEAKLVVAIEPLGENASVATGAAPVPTHLSVPSFVRQLLHPDPSLRGGFGTIRGHPFFAGTPPTFGSAPPHTVPAAPPRARTVAADTRHSGRKQSMMWRQQAVLAASQEASAGVLMTAIPEEEPSVVQYFCGPRHTENDDNEARPAPVAGAQVSADHAQAAADPFEEMFGPLAAVPPARRGGNPAPRNRIPPSPAVSRGGGHSLAGYSGTAKAVSEFYTVMPGRGR